MNAHDHLREARAKLAGLQRILKDMDPASGVSFAVRRGVARDDDEVDNDSTKRPWVTLELSEMALVKDTLDSLIEGAKYNVTFWEGATKRLISEAQKVLDEK